jgi:UDP-glucose 4-epimerase
LEKLLAHLIHSRPEGRPHLVFFSSGGAVYGNAPGRPNRESDPCHPLGNYGRAKLSAEQMILGAAESCGVPAAILRISNPYGYPVPSGRQQGIVPHAIRAAVEQKPLPLWGSGLACKDFLYYTDFLAALHHVMAQRLTGIFNICAGRSHRIDEVIGLVERHTRRAICTQSNPAPLWDVQDSRLDPAKLTAATGWLPQVTLDEGVRRSVAGYLDH